jgi:hypothetical protein
VIRWGCRFGDLGLCDKLRSLCNSPNNFFGHDNLLGEGILHDRCGGGRIGNSLLIFLLMGLLLGCWTRGGLQIAHGEINDVPLVEEPEKIGGECLFTTFDLLLLGNGRGLCSLGNRIGTLR